MRVLLRVLLGFAGVVSAFQQHMSDSRHFARHFMDFRNICVNFGDCPAMTFNQVVDGSIPSGLTKQYQALRRQHPQWPGPLRVLLRVLLQIYPAFTPNVLCRSQFVTASTGYRTRPPILV